jgi:hypothetical protein
MGDVRPSKQPEIHRDLGSPVGQPIGVRPVDWTHPFRVATRVPASRRGHPSRPRHEQEVGEIEVFGHSAKRSRISLSSAIISAIRRRNASSPRRMAMWEMSA